MRCMTAIWPAGPPKLSAATRTQTLSASPKGTWRAGMAAPLMRPRRPSSRPGPSGSVRYPPRLADVAAVPGRADGDVVDADVDGHARQEQHQFAAVLGLHH